MPHPRMPVSCLPRSDLHAAKLCWFCLVLFAAKVLTSRAMMLPTHHGKTSFPMNLYSTDPERGGAQV